MTGYRERCLAAGMENYVSKPLEPADLLQTIASTLTDRQKDPHFLSTTFTSVT